MWNRNGGWLTKLKYQAQIFKEKVGHCLASRDGDNLGSGGHIYLIAMKGMFYSVM